MSKTKSRESSENRTNDKSDYKWDKIANHFQTVGWSPKDIHRIIWVDEYIDLIISI